MRSLDDRTGILRQPVNEDWLDITENGEVYLSHNHVSAILHDAFGPLNWRLVEVAEKILPRSLCRRFDLFVTVQTRADIEAIEGLTLTDAWGEAYYQPPSEQDKKITGSGYANAAESCYSDALKKVGKHLGVAPELQDRRWREAWKQANCCLIWREKKKTRDGYGGWSWRRKDAPKFYDEGPPPGQGGARGPSSSSSSATAPSELPTKKPPSKMTKKELHDAIDAGFAMLGLGDEQQNALWEQHPEPLKLHAHLQETWKAQRRRGVGSER